MLVNPRIEFDIPEGWQFKEEITVVRDPQSANRPSVNLIVSSEPTETGLGAEELARSMAAQLQQEFPAYRELVLEPMDIFDGRPGWLRRFEWEPERGRRITQLQAYYTENGRAYMATATVESDEFPAQRDELLKVLGSLTLRERGDAPGPAPAEDGARRPAG